MVRGCDGPTVRRSGTTGRGAMVWPDHRTFAPDHRTRPSHPRTFAPSHRWELLSREALPNRNSQRPQSIPPYPRDSNRWIYPGFHGGIARFVGNPKLL